MDIIEDLFSDTNVVSTGAVARAFEMSENHVRAWADELGVARIGASFAWAQPDVEALAERLDALNEEDEEDDEDEDEEDDEDEDEDEDEEDDEDEDDEDEEEPATSPRGRGEKYKRWEGTIHNVTRKGT